MAYFTIMTGLRGCYMPDQSYTIKCDTRRELKEVIAEEADRAVGDGDGGGDQVVGLSKKAIAAFVAQCWRDRKDARWSMDYALGWGYRGQISGKPYGIFVSRATRADYLASLEENA